LTRSNHRRPTRSQQRSLCEDHQTVPNDELRKTTGCVLSGVIRWHLCGSQSISIGQRDHAQLNLCPTWAKHSATAAKPGLITMAYLCRRLSREGWMSGSLQLWALRLVSKFICTLATTCKPSSYGLHRHGLSRRFAAGAVPQELAVSHASGLKMAVRLRHVGKVLWVRCQSENEARDFVHPLRRWTVGRSRTIQS
jgi:hypothetical protein